MGSTKAPYGCPRAPWVHLGINWDSPGITLGALGSNFECFGMTWGHLGVHAAPKCGLLNGGVHLAKVVTCSVCALRSPIPVHHERMLMLCPCFFFTSFYLVLPRSRTNRKKVTFPRSFQHIFLPRSTSFYLVLPRSRTNRKEVVCPDIFWGLALHRSRSFLLAPEPEAGGQ